MSIFNDGFMFIQKPNFIFFHFLPGLDYQIVLHFAVQAIQPSNNQCYKYNNKFDIYIYT